MELIVVAESPTLTLTLTLPLSLTLTLTLTQAGGAGRGGGEFGAARPRAYGDARGAGVLRLFA